MINVTQNQSTILITQQRGVFAWEDKFKRLLLRFEVISEIHYGLKCLAYTLINLRHFCKS